MNVSCSLQENPLLLFASLARFGSGMNDVNPNLTVEALQKEATRFALASSGHREPSLYGVTDGKAIGTYLEHKFRRLFISGYVFKHGSSAKGIDFPDLNVDMKVTSIKQPQSSSPFESARQKILGLGYSLLIFIYDKHDDRDKRVAQINIKHTVFVDKSRTADYQITSGVIEIIKHNGNTDDLVAFMNDKNLPIDDIDALQLAKELLAKPPKLGYLTISNALQWRLQYKRIIDKAGFVDGILRVT